MCGGYADLLLCVTLRSSSWGLHLSFLGDGTTSWVASTRHKTCAADVRLSRPPPVFKLTLTRDCQRHSNNTIL